MNFHEISVEGSATRNVRYKTMDNKHHWAAILGFTEKFFSWKAFHEFSRLKRMDSWWYIDNLLRQKTSKQLKINWTPFIQYTENFFAWNMARW